VIPISPPAIVFEPPPEEVSHFAAQVAQAAGAAGQQITWECCMETARAFLDLRAVVNQRRLELKAQEGTV